jgi:ankyrin repeat protein
LITHGADANSTDNRGETPLHTAAYFGYEEINVEIAAILIAHGTDVNVKDTNGLTVLHKTAAKSHTKMVKLLLAHGADVNVRDGNDQTPLDLAQQSGMFGSDAIVALLKSYMDK